MSITRFKRFSNPQLSSPMVVAPIMRPPPFNVWKPRRRSLSASLSPESCHAVRYSLAKGKSSSASSTKISMISSSASSSLSVESTGGATEVSGVIGVSSGLGCKGSVTTIVESSRSVCCVFSMDESLLEPLLAEPNG